MGVDYDPGSGMVVSAFRFTSTIIPMVVNGPEFWLLLIVNLTICSVRHAGYFDPKPINANLPWELTGVTGSLMAFFVVFYNSHVFSRYNKIYDLTRQMLEHCVRTAVMLRVHMPDERVRWKVAKWAITSCLLFFFDRTYPGDELPPDDVRALIWDEFRFLDLLEEEEIEALEKHCSLLEEESMPSFMVLQWSMELIRHSTVDPGPEDRDDMLAAFYASLYQVWNCQSQIKETLELPMPFQYFHIMNLMLCVNLSLWAYSLGCEDSYFAPIIYMFVQMMFQGLRELSGALSDPFGDDEVDFQLNDWVRPMYVRVYSVLGVDQNTDAHADEFDIQNVRYLPEPERCKNHINMYIDVEQARLKELKRKQKRKDKKLQKMSG